MSGKSRESIRQRANARCEYCRLPDFALEPEDFHVEHIVARKHGGRDEVENLAWACIFCNLYKGPNLASFDPDSGVLTFLFNPPSRQLERTFPRRKQSNYPPHLSRTHNVLVARNEFRNPNWSSC